MSSFSNFPVWLKSSIGIFALLVLVGIGLGFGPIVSLIVAIGLLFAIVVLGIYSYLLKQRREARQTALGGELQQSAFATPAAVSDPARKARLEDLRRRFQEGLNRFKAAGKDLYKLPWYVVIGESAAGKSEVIRHCEVGFPPGMQDEFQGVGGTINMNWWFTNYAVILDTAGRLLFEEVAPGSSSEWKEFLGMLRKHRPNCPVNGLLLVIPADSLVKDPAKKIDERAGWIARRLDGIQRELDIRFPVYVIISKCDLLTGFREFFEDVEDPEERRQMLGWSNPGAIDTPFRPDLVDQHLKTVVERLRQRRLKLLGDPVAKDSSHRRIDEVDQLYAFPNSIALLASSLRRYLSTIFVAGEWSAKPLFLRGIYFTSSLREGSELDQELAEALGVSVDALPSGRVWERETSFFLRDLFVEKIFREWGLVTRATNTLRMLRRRQLALFGFGGIALLALLLLSWFGYTAMKNSIGLQSGYWLRAKEGWTAESEWMPIVSWEKDGYVYNGDRSVGEGTALFREPGQSLVEFHGTLRRLAEQKLSISPVFRPFYQLIGNFDSKRKSAQRIVFEGSVVKPVVEAARRKMSTTTAAPSTDPNVEAQALLSLIRIESGIVKRQEMLGEKIAAPESVIGPLITYVVGQPLDPVLVDVGTWTYSKGDGTGKWPGAWLSAGNTLAKGKPGYNEPIDLGIERFRINALQSLAASEMRWNLIVDLADFVKTRFAPKEQALFQGAGNQGNIQQLDPLLAAPYREFISVKQALDGKVQNAKAAGFFGDDKISLVGAYEQIIKERKMQQSMLKSMLEELLTETVAKEAGDSRAPLLKEIQERLGAIVKETQAEIEGLDVAELKGLDDSYFGTYAAHGTAYNYRSDLYALSFGTTQERTRFSKIVGSDWAALKKLIGDIADVRKQVVDYPGKYKSECGSVCAYWLGYAEVHEIDDCCKAYLREAKQAVANVLRFPLVWPPENAALTGDEVLASAELVRIIHRDLSSETFGKIRAESRMPLEKFDKQLAALDPILRALVSPNAKLAVCTISLPAGPPRAQLAIPDPLTNPGATPPPEIPQIAYELRAGTPVSRGHGSLGGQGKVPLGQGRVLIQKLPVDTIFHFHRYDFKTHELECG
ncbi:MAG TPA: type VI secretion protein IcmF/TssM N-terminal domain-containing protein, partial [Terrimicrobiaceae bacterium]